MRPLVATVLLALVAACPAADVTRDALDRVTSVRYPDGSRMEYDYDKGGNVLAARYVAPATAPTPGMSFSVAGNNTASPTLSGTSPSGSAGVRVFVDGALAGTATPGADGSWTFAISSLAPGSHAVSVSAVDAAGAVLASSASQTVTAPGSVPTGGGGTSSGSSSGSGGGGGGGGCGVGGGIAVVLGALALARIGRKKRVH